MWKLIRGLEDRVLTSFKDDTGSCAFWPHEKGEDVDIFNIQMCVEWKDNTSSHLRSVTSMNLKLQTGHSDCYFESNCPHTYLADLL